jgi:hypothetical protein
MSYGYGLLGSHFVIDANLHSACESVTEWCQKHTIPFDIACDEDDLQGILIFRRHSKHLPELINHLLPRLRGLHLEQVQVRAGTVLLLSLKALNEAQIEQAIGERAVRSEFQALLNKTFSGRPVVVTTPEPEAQKPLRDRLFEAARALAMKNGVAGDLEESQHMWATAASKRAGALNQFKKSIVRGHGDGQKGPEGSAEGAQDDGLDKDRGTSDTGRDALGESLRIYGGKEAGQGKEDGHARLDEINRLLSKQQYGDKSTEAANRRRLKREKRQIHKSQTQAEAEFRNRLDTVLAELAQTPGAAPPASPQPGAGPAQPGAGPAQPGAAPGAEQGQPSMQGLGSEHQPDDLFQRFSQAMAALGQQMNLGAPLQDLLKKQGIRWKLAEDGQAVIFYVNNGDTGAPQPIARVGYQTLGKAQEFQKQLASMVDFARGQAPGTEQAKYEEAQEAQKRLRELANQFAPPQDGKGAGAAAASAPNMFSPQQGVSPAPPGAGVGPAGPGGAGAGPAKPMGPTAPQQNQQDKHAVGNGLAAKLQQKLAGGGGGGGGKPAAKKSGPNANGAFKL